MKKILLFFGFILSFCTYACGAAPAAPAAGNTAKPATAVSVEVKVKKVVLTINGKQAVLDLYDTPVSNALYAKLPLTLTFSDFNNTEKIARLDNPIHEGYKPEGHAPKVGDLCLYAPWGNLCFFYHDYRHSGDLFSLGRLESGLELLTAQQGDFTVKLEPLSVPNK